MTQSKHRTKTIGRPYLNVCVPSISEKEISYVQRAVREGQISSTAKYVGIFEEKFAKRMKVRYAVAVNSGGSALFLALWAIGVRKGDEVIIPSFTMVATANAVVQCGATPVFVDSEENGNIDISKIENKITKKTKAIIPVHVYGHPVDMDELLAIARKYKLLVVEDAAEAHGALYKGRPVGSLGDVSCFSFYANKLMTTGEGGMVVTNNLKLARKIGKLRAYYFSDKLHFWHEEQAWNMRMSSLEAALGLSQLERLDELISMRRANRDYYNNGLANLSDHIIFPTEKKYVKSVYWMYGIVLKQNNLRDKLMKHLEKSGIETRTFFFPMHWQPIYRKQVKQKEKFPVADFLGRNGLYLPSSSQLTNKEKDRVINSVQDFFKNL